jgi:hypothetical protein
MLFQSSQDAGSATIEEDMSDFLERSFNHHKMRGVRRDDTGYIVAKYIVSIIIRCGECDMLENYVDKHAYEFQSS